MTQVSIAVMWRAMQMWLRQNLPWILSVQLLLVFFAPPIAWHDRSIYLGDIWCAVWVFIGYATSLTYFATEPRKKFFRDFAISVALIGLVYLHGFFRPELLRALDWSDAPVGEDRFSFFREGVVAFRFLTWIWAGTWIVSWVRLIDSKSRNDWIDLLVHITTWIVVAIGGIAIMVHVIPSLTDLLGSIYGYNPHTIAWNGRSHVTFRSPNETGMALAFAILLIINRTSISRSVRFSAVIVGFVGIILTQSATPMLTLGFCFAISLIRRLRLNPRLFVSLGVIAAAMIFLELNFGHFTNLQELITMKMGHFNGRIQPWIVYLQIGVQRLDYLLLGTGFHSLHVDNFYLYLFSRGGLLLIAAFLWVLSKPLFRFAMSNQSASIVIFLLLTSLTLDSLILRPIVALLLVLGLPILVNNELTSGRNLF